MTSDHYIEMESALMLADEERVRRAIDAGADPCGSLDDAGYTWLHMAADRHMVEVARLLLDRGADAVVNAREPRFANSPLHRAIHSSRGRGELIQLLLAHGADPYLPDHLGDSPRQWADQPTQYDIAQFFADVPRSDAPDADQT